MFPPVQFNFDTTDTLSYSTPVITSIFGKTPTELKKTLLTRFYPLSPQFYSSVKISQI